MTDLFGVIVIAFLLLNVGAAMAQVFWDYLCEFMFGI